MSGIDGITLDSVTRKSDTQVRVELEFDGNISSDRTLTFTLEASAIVEYTGAALEAQVSVTAVTEWVVASTASPLTKTTLDESVVTVTLSGRTYEPSWRLRNNVAVSGIDGVTIDRVTRISDSQVGVELEFDGDISTDSTLTFTVEDGGISSYTAAHLPRNYSCLPTSKKAKTVMSTVTVQ